MKFFTSRSITRTSGWLNGHLIPALFPIGSADSADAEREKRSPRLGESSADGCLRALELYEIVQRLFPLPAGEGQGEGERFVCIERPQFYINRLGNFAPTSTHPSETATRANRLR